MELRVLKYFLMVAREENITKAAQLLHVTQPTLSRQLMQLEEELGVQLFHRGKHKVTLTEDGMLLRRRAQELVSLSEKTKMELQHKEGMPTGEIAIGCGETKSMAALSGKMVSFRQKYPLVQFSIYSAIADDIKERLEKGLLDMGLLVEPVDISKYEFIRISKLCVGCMSFGKAGTMHDWTLDETETEKVVKHALSLGINFFDTANGYSAGTSEEYLGRAIKKNIARDKVVIASKVYFNPGRLSAEAIHREIDGTLKRLGTDYLDLYIIHRFDYDTPIEETMEALNDLVTAGKVRALGASAMYGYQFYNMQLAARDHGWAQFQAMENHYNLLYREDERELIPICKQMGVSLMPYSPLAAGHLTRPQWNTDTLRSQTDRVAMGKYDRTEEQDMQIVLRVHELAERYGVKMQQIALAWHWAKGVAAPIIGATKASHFDDAAGALDVKLTAEDVAYLEEPYLPHRVVGAIDHNPADGVMLLDEKK